MLVQLTFRKLINQFELLKSLEHFYQLHELEILELVSKLDEPKFVNLSIFDPHLHLVSLARLESYKDKNCFS